MTKKLLVVLLVTAFAATLFLAPKVSFAEGNDYGTALNAYNAKIEQADSELIILNEKMTQVKEKQKEIFTALKEKKDAGEDLSEEVKPLVKKLMWIKKSGERLRDIRDARLYYAKILTGQLKEKMKEIKEMKESGANEEELKNLLKEAHNLKEKVGNVLPFSLKLSVNRADRVRETAEKLKANEKEDRAVKLLESATKRIEREIEITHKQAEILDKILDLLNQIGDNLGI
jgi:chromosome segregation ATPase